MIMFNALKATYVYCYETLITFDKGFHFNCDNKPLTDKRKLDIATIAFNNEQVIAEQVRLLNKNLLDPYCYTVADNSCDPAKQELIMRICEELQVGYIKLPRNFYNRRAPSSSHGLALNWVYKNYIRPRQAHFFGFTDHDIYPTRPTSIIGFLEKSPVYGLIQEREEVWYLWPGFCFFKRDYIKDKDLNFMPSKRGDTGAGNWASVYSKLDKSKVPCLRHEYSQLGERENNLIEYIGDWLHTFNASNWRKVEGQENKSNLVTEILSKY